MYDLCFFLWLILLCITGSRFINLSTADLNLLPFYGRIIVHWIVFFSHSSVKGYLDHFWALVIVNSAAMNIGAHMSFRSALFSGHIPSSGIACWHSSLFLLFFFVFFFFFNFVFSKKSPCCSQQWPYQFTFPPIAQEGSLFSTCSLAFIVCRFFWWWPFWLMWGDASLQL